ncbi:hypothetical protein Tco_0536879 [Tanacetum coccineum]
MASMNTRLNIEKLDGNIVQKHGGLKQVGFKQLGPGVETGVHGVHDEKRVWFKVELQGAQGDREAEVFQVSNDDTRVAQRRLEDKQPKEKTNTDCLVKEQKKEYQTGWKIKTGNVLDSCNQSLVCPRNMGFNESGEYKKTFIGSGVARDKEQHSAHELLKYREDSNEAAFAVAEAEKIYAHESLTFNNTVACEPVTVIGLRGYIDNYEIHVKRKVMALTEAMELEVDRREDAGTGMLLLANEEFDKETGGYRCEPEEAEEEISEEEPSPKETASKKTKASAKLQCSKKKKHRSEVLNGAEDKFVADAIDIVNKRDYLPRNVKGDEQTSATPDEAKKPQTHFEPEVSKAENKEVSKDPSPTNKADNSWTKIKNDSGWNKWADNGFVVHLKGSALGPTLKLLRSTKKHWLC